MCTQPAEISFEMPSSVSEEASKCGQKVSVEDRMAFVQDAARTNVRLQTGGPFAAAILAELPRAGLSPSA